MNNLRVSLRVFLLYAAGMTVMGCQTPVVITHGISFGHCQGYCHKELLIAKDSMTYIQRKNGDLPETKKCVRPLSKEIYAQVISTFDFKSFSRLDSVTGCPDCADGGAEWIEVRTGKKIKRVTFEYHKSPEQLKAAVEQISRLQAGMEDCKL